MEIKNWELVFKFNYHTKKIVETNLVYTPLTDGKIFCMNFDHTHPYQNEMVSSFLPVRPFYNEETTNFFFKRELEFIEKFKNYSWTPNYLEVDKKFKKIFFEWPGESFNKIVSSNADINNYCPNWENQLEKIILEIIDAGCYKLTIYPHCFFSNFGIMKTFDFYGCAYSKYPYLPLEKVKGIMGVASSERFEKAINNNEISIKELFIQALNGYSCWPTDKLKKIIPMIL